MINNTKRRKTKHSKIYKIIGNNIKIKRKECGLSQEELGFSASSTRNYIGCIERGEKAASVAFLFDIAKVLNCSLIDLFKGT